MSTTTETIVSLQQKHTSDLSPPPSKPTKVNSCGGDSARYQSKLTTTNSNISTSSKVQYSKSLQQVQTSAREREQRILPGANQGDQKTKKENRCQEGAVPYRRIDGVVKGESGSLLGNNMSHEMAETLARILQDKLKFMQLEFEQFVELLMTSCFKKTYNAGDIIYRAGEREFHCVFITTGQVSVCSAVRSTSVGSGGDSKGQLTREERVVEAPDVLGAGALLLCETRHNTVCVLSSDPVESYMLHQKTFQNFFQNRTKSKYDRRVSALSAIPQFSHLKHEEKDKIMQAADEINLGREDKTPVVRAKSEFTSLYVAFQGSFFNEAMSSHSKGVKLIGWTELIEDKDTWDSDWWICQKSRTRKTAEDFIVLKIDLEKVDRILGLTTLTRVSK